MSRYNWKSLQTNNGHLKKDGLKGKKFLWTLNHIFTCLREGNELKAIKTDHFLNE